nr:ATP-dependent DNA helicase PIF1 [Tanacetum cinerariifolium]
MRSADKLANLDHYDKVICAEIPDPNKHPELHQLVLKHMIHGPCGHLNTQCSCMEGEPKKCHWNYPRQFQETTQQGDDLYPLHRRRYNGIEVNVQNNVLDNRWVVPYNPKLLMLFNCHINVEVYSRPTGFDYLYTVNDVLYGTFCKAALERGLIKSDDYMHAYLLESSTHEMPNLLRRLFAMLQIFYEPGDVHKLWDDHYESLSEDYILDCASVERVQNMVLMDISLILQSMGAAANNMTRGRTAHSRFKIPINLTTNSMCNIKKQSDLAKLLCQEKLIIWDETSMAKRQVVEAVDRTMQDIIGVKLPFGGKIMNYDLLIDRFLGEEKVYYSFEEAEDDTHNFYPLEFLNSLNVTLMMMLAAKGLRWKLFDFTELKRSSMSYLDLNKHMKAISRWSRSRTRAAKVGHALPKNSNA